jgi:hypothetical protein
MTAVLQDRRVLVVEVFWSINISPFDMQVYAVSTPTNRYGV